MISQYKPSERFDFSTLAFMLPAMALGAGLGVVYQMVVNLCPLIFINFFLTIGCGIVLGLFGALVVKLSKCRSHVVALTTGVMISAAALIGGHWQAYRHFNDQATAAFQQEGRIQQGERLELPFSLYLEGRQEIGWTLSHRRAKNGGLQISGLAVLLIWLLEALILLIKTVGITAGAATQPYCEGCNCWADRESVVREHALETPQALMELVQAETTELLLRPLPSAREMIPGSKPHRVKYLVSHCPKCSRTAYLTIQLVSDVVDKEGNNKEETRVIVRDVCLSESDLHQLVAEQQRGAQGPTHAQV